MVLWYRFFVILSRKIAFGLKEMVLYGIVIGKCAVLDANRMEKTKKNGW